MAEPSDRDRFRLDDVLTEKSLLIRSGAQCRYVRLTRGRQIAALALGVGLAGWATLSTGLLLVEAFERADDRAALREAAALYQSRFAGVETALAEVAAARDAAEARARAARAATDAARTEAATSVAMAEAAQARAEADRDELADALLRVAEALDAAALARDDAEAESAQMRTAVGALETTAEARRDAQARVIAELEAAAEASIGSLESVLRGAGVDVDAILRSLKAGGGASGGPFVPAPLGVGALAPDEKAAVVEVMSDLERVTLLRAAARRMPFGRPVAASVRMTSPFGVRRDPVNGRRAMHEGIDFAGRHGTPILSAAEGEVVFAGRMSGYGNVVKVRHAFGFETVYAHLSRVRVAVGAKVKRGARIGDMGSTGRSTGTHLHYEVRVSGKPVNPRKFIEAARHVDVL